MENCIEKRQAWWIVRVVTMQVGMSATQTFVPGATMPHAITVSCAWHLTAYAEVHGTGYNCCPVDASGSLRNLLVSLKKTFFLNCFFFFSIIIVALVTQLPSPSIYKNRKRLSVPRSQRALTLYPVTRLRCCDRYIQCQWSLAVKLWNSRPAMSGSHLTGEVCVEWAGISLPMYNIGLQLLGVHDDS